MKYVFPIYLNLKTLGEICLFFFLKFKSLFKEVLSKDTDNSILYMTFKAGRKVYIFSHHTLIQYTEKNFENAYIETRNNTIFL